MNLVRALQPSRRRQKGEGGQSIRGRESSLTGQPTPQELQEGRRSGGPTLVRCNAIKRIDFDASGCVSDESVRGGGAVGGGGEGRLTCSLEVLPAASPVLPVVRFGSQASFRISGEVEGEFDALCRSWGLSGPDDFAITPADWEIFGSYGIHDDSTGQGAANVEDRSKFRPEEPPEQLLSLPQRQVVREEEDWLGAMHESFRFEVEPVRKSLFPTNVVSRGSGGGGIKGPRPSQLVPPPPMSLPVLIEVSNTWDIVRSFAPDDGYKSGGAAYQRRESSSEQEDEKETEEEDDGDLLGENAELEGDAGGLRMGMTSMDLIASCSFWTSNDDDSSSTTTDGTYVISPVSKLRRNIESWTKGQLLGSGSFGTVYEAMSDDGFFFAVKEVSLLDQGMNAQQRIHQLEQEIALLSQFEHENIVQYLGTAKEEAKLCIFLELVSQGSLASLYQKYHLRDSQVSAYTRQILNGLRYLHDRNVVHRDIKCANILVDANGSVKLADFGLAKEIKKCNGVKSCKGSVYWMAPEVVKPKRTYGPSADIWSLGCTVLEMLTRQHPFPDLEWTQALFLIGRGRRPHVPDSLSRDAHDFIGQCTQVDPESRPSASSLLDHPFVKRLLPTSSADSSTHDSIRRTWLQT